MILGPSRLGPSVLALAPNQLRLEAGELPAGERLVRLIAYLEGIPAAAGTQPARAVVYDATGPVVAVGEEVTLQPDQGAGWVTFPFADAGEIELPEEVRFGLHSGGSGAVVNFRHETVGASRYNATDSYADGSPATLPALTTTAGPRSFYLETLTSYAAPNVEDAALARLPWTLSQRFLGATGPLAATRTAATAGWYGSTTDPEQGANCVVRTDGPLAELVGERLRVTYRLGTLRRSVAVYVHDEQDFGPDAADEDLALSRRAFMAIAPLATEALPVEVEVLA